MKINESGFTTLRNRLYSKETLTTLLVFLGPVGLFLPTLISGRALYWGTPGLQFIPWRAFAWDAISQGSLPLWNPLNGMGAPLAANYQLALYYPPGWVLFIADWLGGVGWMAWTCTLLIALHLAWGGLGMARVLRNLEAGWLGQVVSGICFSLCGYFVARAGFFSMVWTGVWLPWIFAYTSRIASQVHPFALEAHAEARTRLKLTLSIAMMLLAGHAQLSWYILLLTVAWVIFNGVVKNGCKIAARSLAAFLSCLGVGAMIAAVQLLPTTEYLLNSQRSVSVNSERAFTYSFWPWRITGLLAPDLFGNPASGNYWGYASYWEDAVYIGVIPFLLAMSVLVKMIFSKKESPLRKHQFLVAFLFCLMTISFVFALGDNTPIFPFFYRHVPTFDMFNAPARYMVWFEFAIILLAGLGADHWSRPYGKKLYWYRLATAGGFAITLGAVFASVYFESIKSTVITATALTGVLALCAGLLTLLKPVKTSRIGAEMVWIIAVLGILYLDLWLVGWKINPSSDRSLYSEKNANLAGIQSEIGDGRTYLSPEDEYYLKFRRFLRFNNYQPIEDLSSLRYVLLPDLNLLDDLSVANNFDPLLPARYVRWMDHLAGQTGEKLEAWLRIMNVRYRIARDNENILGVKYQPVAGAMRVYWTPCIEPAQNSEQALSLVDAHLESISNQQSVVIEGSVGAMESCSRSGKTAQLVYQDVSPTRLDIAIASPSDGWVILADTWYPGWRAKLDGNNVEIAHANFLFRGIRVPAGNHDIKMQFLPASFSFGAGITIAGMVIMLLYASISYTKK